MTLLAGWALSQPETDKTHFLGVGEASPVLEGIVEDCVDQGIAITDYGVKATDSEETFQVVIDRKYDKPVLVANEIWRQAALAKARGESVPMVEVFQFDADGNMTFGLGQATLDVQDVTYGKELATLQDSQQRVEAALDDLVARMPGTELEKGVSVDVQVVADPDAGRRMAIRLQFPEATPNQDLDVVVRQVGTAIGRLNVENQTGIGVAEVTVYRGEQLLLQEANDFQLDSVRGWHDPSYVPGSLSVSPPAPSGQ